MALEVLMISIYPASIPTMVSNVLHSKQVSCRITYQPN